MAFSSQAFRAPQLGRKRVSFKKTLGDVAQSGVNPATGEYLSSGERKALFRTRNIDAQKVFGKSGAIVKLDSLGPIVKTGQDEDQQQSGSQTNAESLGSRVTALEKSVITIQESIKKLSEFLVDDAKKEQQLLLKGQKTEDIAKEKEKRRRKESGLESVARGIGNTLMAPIKAIGGKVKGILSRVLEFLKILFVGWLTDKGVKAFRAYMDGNKEEFERIGKNILGALGIVMGIIAGVNVGLAAIPGLILGILPTIATLGAAIVGFLLSPAGLTTLAFLGLAGLAGLGMQTITKQQFKSAYGDEQEYMDEGAFALKLLKQYGSSATEKQREENLTPSEKQEYKFLQDYHQVLKARGDAFNQVNKLKEEVDLLDKQLKEGEQGRGAGVKRTRYNNAKRDLKFQEAIFEQTNLRVKELQNDLRLKGKTLKQLKSDFDSGKIIQTGISQAETPQKSRTYGLGYSIKQKVTPTPTPTPTSTRLTVPLEEIPENLDSPEGREYFRRLDAGELTTPLPTPAPPKPEPKKEPKVIFRPNPQVQQKEPVSVTNGSSKTPNIASSNPNNFYTMYSQIQYNVV